MSGKKVLVIDPEGVEYYINLLGVSRYLERIADHATNIAEDVVYLVEGTSSATRIRCSS